RGRSNSWGTRRACWSRSLPRRPRGELWPSSSTRRPSSSSSHTMERRLDAEAPPADARELRTATYILMGLRYPRDMVRQLLKGVRSMKESDTYQAILEEGFEKGIEKGRAEGVEKGRA